MEQGQLSIVGQVVELAFEPALLRHGGLDKMVNVYYNEIFLGFYCILFKNRNFNK
jgi:hypothetical protein